MDHVLEVCEVVRSKTCGMQCVDLVLVGELLVVSYDTKI